MFRLLSSNQKRARNTPRVFPKIAGSLHSRTRDSGRSGLFSQIELFGTSFIFLRQIALLTSCFQFLTFAVFSKLFSSREDSFPFLIIACQKKFCFSEPVIFALHIFRNQRTDVELSTHAVDDTVRQRLQTDIHHSRSLACQVRCDVEG